MCIIPRFCAFVFLTSFLKGRHALALSLMPNPLVADLAQSHSSAVTLPYPQLSAFSLKQTKQSSLQP